MTSLSQLLAEGPGTWRSRRWTFVLRRHGPLPVDMGTFGSLSIRSFGPVCVMRPPKRGASCWRWPPALQVPVASLTVESRVVRAPRDRGRDRRRSDLRQLTEGKRIERTLSPKPAVKPVKAFTIVGTSAPRRDATEKVTGKAKYAGDIAPAGALHARILRPPAHGAVLASADTSAAEKMPGVTVIRDGDLIAVLHQHWDESRQGAGARQGHLHAQRSPSRQRHDLRSPREERAARAARRGGRRPSTYAGPPLQVFEQTYYDSYMAHATMETHSRWRRSRTARSPCGPARRLPFP